MKKTCFGIVGTGRISDWVLKGAVLEPRFEAAAVCSRSEDNAVDFASRHGIEKIFTDIDMMASDPSIDAIYIGTPNHTHHDLAIKCMNHGKHVLCEKPLASNSREVREMAACAKANGVVLTDEIRSNVILMNPMIFVGNPKATNAPHWYVRHGARDRDTSFPVPVAFATKLQNAGLDVDFLLAWNRPHSGEYALDEVFDWIAQITGR